MVVVVLVVVVGLLAVVLVVEVVVMVILIIMISRNLNCHSEGIPLQFGEGVMGNWYFELTGGT